MFQSNKWVLIAVVAFVSVAAEQAFAQSGTRGASNIYQNITSRPTVSPYLNLINPNPNSFSSSVGRYQNFVRPQLDQFDRNVRTQSRLRGLQNQIQQIQTTAIGPARNGMGQQQQVFATGHPSVFQYYSHFYAIGR